MVSQVIHTYFHNEIAYVQGITAGCDSVWVNVGIFRLYVSSNDTVFVYPIGPIIIIIIIIIITQQSFLPKQHYISY